MRFILIFALFLFSCDPPKPSPVHIKPFYVNDKDGGFGQDYCYFQVIDVNNNFFTITELCNKYNVGDTIR